MSDRWQQLRELAEAATPGPWRAVCRDCNNPKNELPWDRHEFLQWELEGPDVPSGRGEFFGEDAHFIAAARDAVGPLLAERDELLAALRELVGAMNDGSGSLRYYRAIAAAERLAGDKTE